MVKLSVRERESTDRAESGAEEKKNHFFSLFDQKNTSPFMYWQRWKAHGDRGSLAGRIKDPSVDDFTIWIFLETQNIFMAWETIWRYKQKAYSGDFMAALSQQWSTSEGNWEFERVFFFQTFKQQEGNYISSTWTSSHLVSRAQQVVQEVTGLTWNNWGVHLIPFRGEI